MTINYLLSKVRKPRIQPDLVLRPHLTDVIEKGSWRKFTLVCAPPGFGKTTLLLEWSQMTRYPVCWFQEDEQDNLLDNFLGYLCLSIQQVSPEFGTELMHSIKLSPRPGIDHFANTFIQELDKLPQKVSLVLDDHHLITNLEIHQFLRIVLDYLPQNIHIVISTREDPPIPLGKYRARNELTEIRTTDLRFNKNEAKEFIDTITHLPISATALDALHERTEGWAAGIQLAGLSIMESNDPDKFISDFTGSNRFIIDYLVEDVLNRQPPEIREFLLKTSVRAAEAAAARRALVRRLLREYGLPDLDDATSPAAALVSEPFIESLMAATSEVAMRRLIHDRAALARSGGLGESTLAAADTLARRYWPRRPLEARRGPATGWRWPPARPARRVVRRRHRTPRPLTDRVARHDGAAQQTPRRRDRRFSGTHSPSTEFLFKEYHTWQTTCVGDTATRIPWWRPSMRRR